MGWRAWLARRRLVRTQWYPPGRLEQLQAAGLRRLLRDAYAESAYYHRLLSAAGVDPGRIRSLRDLERVPLTTREQMSRFAGEITARRAERFHPTPLSTGGTTGAPLQVLVDRDNGRMVIGARARSRGWVGVHKGDRLAEFRRPDAFRLPSGEQDQQTLSRFLPAENILRFNPFAIKGGQFGAIAAELERFQPEAVVCPPSLLTFLSLYLLEHPTYRIRPRAIICGGERLFSDQRETIAQAFSCQVFESYGNREHATLAGECREGRLHFAAEVAIVEFIKDGRRCLPGETGEMIVTNFWNRSFPLIRYAIGDVGYLDPDPCPCGRGLPTGRIVGGKERSLLATPTGYLYLSHSLFARPEWRGKITGIRYYQTTRGAVTAQVVKGPAFLPTDEQALIAVLDGFFGGQLKISVEYFESLDQTAGGKYRFVVSTVPLAL